MFETVTGWLGDHRVFATWMGILSVVMFIGGLVLAPLLVARMPADFFVATRPSPASWPGRHPVLRILLRVLKNLLGCVLVLLGAAMLVLPGQGILTILMGVGLLEFPGKRRMELAIARERHVRALLNGIRGRAGQPPFELPDPPPVNSPGA